jgi:hypothetical protein
MPAIAALTMSAIMAVPHGPFDVRAVEDTQVEQGAIIEPRQRSHGQFDPPLAFAPAHPSRAIVRSSRVDAENPVLPRGSVRSFE